MYSFKSENCSVLSVSRYELIQQTLSAENSLSLAIAFPVTKNKYPIASTLLTGRKEKNFRKLDSKINPLKIILGH